MALLIIETDNTDTNHISMLLDDAPVLRGATAYLVTDERVGYIETYLKESDKV